MSDTMDRFISKIRIDEDSGCWLWIASKDNAGYGRFRIGDANMLAHRLSYQLFVGEVTPVLVIHHRCNNKACVNPEHLEQITKRENTTWGGAHNRNLTHCRRGHEFTEANTYIGTGNRRVCITCKHEHYIRGKDRQIYKAKVRSLLRSLSEEQIVQLIKELTNG